MDGWSCMWAVGSSGCGRRRGGGHRAVERRGGAGPRRRPPPPPPTLAHPTHLTLSPSPVPAKDGGGQGAVPQVRPALVPALPEQPLRGDGGRGRGGWRVVWRREGRGPACSLLTPHPSLSPSGRHRPRLGLPPVPLFMQLLQLPQAGRPGGDRHPGDGVESRRLCLGLLVARQKPQRQAPGGRGWWCRRRRAQAGARAGGGWKRRQRRRRARRPRRPAGRAPRARRRPGRPPGADAGA